MVFFFLIELLEALVVLAAVLRLNLPPIPECDSPDNRVFEVYDLERPHEEEEIVPLRDFPRLIAQPPTDKLAPLR